MSVDQSTAIRRSSARVPVVIHSAPPAATAGWVNVNPRFRARLAALGLTSAEVLLDLPGEVVSGHPDRHVVRVELPGWGGVLYLKRQHRVGWRERLRQRFAGFGWASRCGREAAVLRDLAAAGHPAPAWVAHGEDGRGRAFLLVEELAGAIELRRLLGDNALSPDDRARLAEHLGRAVAELHAAGFDTPDLTAKHVFVNPATLAVTLIDWQSARRVRVLGTAARARALAALHASLADHLAGPKLRARFLWAYRRAGAASARFAVFACDIERRALRALERRGVRDQRQPTVTDGDPLRLVWLAGEAVCAIPEIAVGWPSPAVAAPFYAESGPAEARIRLADGRPAALIRGNSFAPLGRFMAWLRGKPWRSPGATLGRVLFHLQRYGIAAPRLLAFGQRTTGRATAEWFALHAPPAGRPLAERALRPGSASHGRDVFAQVGQLLRQLHDAGCRYPNGPPLRVADGTGRVSVGAVRAVRLVRTITAAHRRSDLLGVLRTLPGGATDRLRVVRGYFGMDWSRDPVARRTARLALSRKPAGGRR